VDALVLTSGVEKSGVIDVLVAAKKGGLNLPQLDATCLAFL